MSGIQTDFGGFSTTFFGITVRFANPRAWEFFRASLGDGAPLPADRELSFEALAAVSALPHEIRHFHDSLLTPYGARQFRLRTHWLFNAWQAVVRIRELPGNMLPVPLSRWCKMDEGERATFVETLPRRRDGVSWAPVALPHLGDGAERWPDVAPPFAQLEDAAWPQLIHGVLATRAAMDDVALDEGVPVLQPWQVLELSALLVQIQTIYNMYGEAALGLFLNRMLALGEGPYTKPLQAAVALSRRSGREFNMPLVSTAAAWSLFGDYGAEGIEAGPSRRFARAFIALMAKGDLPERPEDVLEYLGKILGRGTIEDGCALTTQLYDQLAEKFTKLTSEELAAGGDPFAPMLSRVSERAASMSRSLVNRVATAPALYCEPWSYSQAFSKDLPLVIFEFDGIGIPEEDIDAKNVLTGATLNDGRRVVLSMLATGAKELGEQGLTDILHFRRCSSICEYVFSAQRRGSRYVQDCGRDFFSKAGLTPVEVF